MSEYIRVYINVLGTKYEKDVFSIIDEIGLPISEKDIFRKDNLITFVTVGYCGMYEDFYKDLLKISFDQLDLEYAIATASSNLNEITFYKSANFDGLEEIDIESKIESENENLEAIQDNDSEYYIISNERTIEFIAKNRLIMPNEFFKALVSISNDKDELDKYIKIAVSNGMKKMESFLSQKVIPLYCDGAFKDFK